MSQKRGQVSVFIIIGIVVLVVIGALFYLRGEGAGPIVEEPVSIDTSSLKSFVSSCAKQTAQEAVVYTAMRGGLYKGTTSIVPSSPMNYHIYNGIAIPYYFYEGEERQMGKEDIKSTLEKYMNGQLKECTGGFQSFKEQGYDIEEEDVESEAAITEEKVMFTINYPVTIKADDAREKAEEFSAEANARFPLMLRAVDDYIDAQKQKPGAFRVGSLMEISSDRDLTFEAIDRGDGTAVISFIDDDLMIQGNPFIYTFAVKYDWSDMETSPE